MKKCFKIFWCILLVVYSTKAQNPLHKRFALESGIPLGAIFDLHQAKNGFIYLATEEGLLRFDGKKTFLFSAKDVYRKSVTNILEADDGTLFVQNFGGQFFKLPPESDSLEYIDKIETQGVFKYATLTRNNNIVFIAPNFIGCYNYKINRVTKVPLKTLQYYQSSARKGKNDLTLIDLKYKTVFAKHYNNQLKYNFKKNTTLFFHAQFNYKNLLLSKLYPFTIEHLLSNDTICLKEINKEAIINHITIVDNKFLAVLTTNGAYIYDKSYKLIYHWFAKESISGMIKDSQNNYWLSTLNNSLILIAQPNTKHYLLNKSFTTINFKGDKFIAGTTDNEIYEWDGDNKTKLIFKDSVTHGVRALLYNKQAEELIFSNQFFHRLGSNINLNNKLSVNSITQVSPNGYLIAEGSTVSFYNISEKDSLFKSFKINSSEIFGNRFSLSKNIYRSSVAKLINGNEVIAATTSGLISFEAGVEKNILFGNKKINAVSIENISSDSLLIATQNQGVLLYTKKRISSFLPITSFKYPEIYKMKLYENKIFIVNYYGCDVYDYNKKLITSYAISDGIYGCDLLDFVVKDNVTYVANLQGVFKLNYTEVAKNNSPPKIIINYFKINNKKVNKFTNHQLPYQTYVLDIEFSAIDFKGLSTTKVYYRINDGDWIETTENRILLTSLGPNDYNLQIKAINEKGLETLYPAQIKFTINNPFYKTWYFIGGISVLLIGIIVTLFMVRLKSSQSRNKILAEKIELQKSLYKSNLASIKSQMNPHFIFNALNTIQSFIYLNEKEAASQYLVNFSELTRLILEMSNKEKVHLSEEIKAIELYLKLEKMRFEDSFKYSINYTSNINKGVLFPSMLIQPYVENAIKHGLLHKKGEKILELNFSSEKNVLTVEIIDNGIGIEASKEINKQRNKNHTSFATQANQKRFELLNESFELSIGVEIINLYNTNNQPAGTKVLLKIPIS